MADDVDKTALRHREETEACSRDPGAPPGSGRETETTPVLSAENFTCTSWNANHTAPRGLASDPQRQVDGAPSGVCLAAVGMRGKAGRGQLDGLACRDPGDRKPWAWPLPRSSLGPQHPTGRGRQGAEDRPGPE